ncbi:MAG: hypothetical protein ACFB6R_08995 [Alphaproteobacteria bacterium]
MTPAAQRPAASRKQPKNGTVHDRGGRDRENGNLGNGNRGNGNRGDRSAALSPEDAAAIVRHLGYLHQEGVRHRLHFLIWVMEMALLHLAMEVPSVRDDVEQLKPAFRF